MALAALDDEFDGLVRDALVAADVPGAAFGVAHGDDVWMRAYGVTERGGGVPVTPETTFRIASITKPFTATLALSLQIAGALEFDDVVAAPEPDVTVRHLLSHLGGFESECGDLSRFGEGDDALPRLAAELLRQRQLVRPGEVWSYCNAGYWLLAHVLGNRNGTTYEAALDEWVLQPLGLRSTHWGEPEAAGHDPGPQRPHHPRARRASGGLTSNVPDVLAFARLHLDAPETAALREPVARTPDGFYGLGLGLEPLGDLQPWGHIGNWGGAVSRLTFEPERDFVFVALANTATAGRTLRELEDEAVARVLGTRRAEQPTVPLPPEELSPLAARYETPAGSFVTLTPEAGGLAVEATATPPTHARSLGNRVFEVVGGPLRGLRFDFHPEEGEPRFVRFGARLVERVYETT